MSPRLLQSGGTVEFLVTEVQPMIRPVLVLILAGTFATAQSQTSIPADLTLNQALEIALRNSSIIKQARADLQRASGQYQQARSTLLPQAGIFAHQGYQTLNLQ